MTKNDSMANWSRIWKWFSLSRKPNEIRYKMLDHYGKSERWGFGEMLGKYWQSSGNPRHSPTSVAMLVILMVMSENIGKYPRQIPNIREMRDICWEIVGESVGKKLRSGMSEKSECVFPFLAL